jgi:tyrocidine synthetase-3
MFKDNLLLFSSKFVKQKDYWINRLSGEIEETVLGVEKKNDWPCGEYKEQIAISFSGGEAGEVENEVPARLIKLSKNSDIALYILLLTMLKVLIYRCTGKEDIIIEAPVYKMKISQETINDRLFIRDHLTGAMTFKEAVFAVRETLLQAHSNQDYPSEKFAEYLFNTPQTPGNNAVSNIACSLKNIHDKRNIDGIKCKIHFLFEREGEAVNGKILYTPDIYDTHYIESISRHFAGILASVIRDANTPINDIDFLSTHEKRRLLVEFNDNKTSYPRDKTISQLLEEQVYATPERIAVIYRDQVLSYQELNQRANRLGNLLRKKGVKPGIIVGIMVESSLEMIWSILGILKAGGAYLPLDLDHPWERKRYMLQDSNSRILVTRESVARDMDYVPEIILLAGEEIQRGDNSNPESIGKAVDLAYVIYTSGTTGRPKGTMTDHFNVVRVVRNTNYIELTRQDRVLQLSNYAFDGSVFDIYGALLNGAGLVMVPGEEVLEVDKLAELINKEWVSVFFVTTAYFNSLVDIKIECFAHIRNVLFGGERVSVGHTRKALEFMGEGRILHVYGPTESTVFAFYYPVNDIDERLGTIPIGGPLANTEAYVVDKFGKILPLGAAGELWLGGDGLSRGYMNNVELTAENFIKNPFLRGKGEKLYRTGDLVRWLPGGDIEFIGRVDRQVKIRGYRIEPDEISSQLLEIDYINEAVVLVRQKSIPWEGSENYLCAYVVAQGKIDPMEVKEILSGKLPDFMVPSFFVQLDEMPLNPNGKIDKKALPTPEIKAEGEYVPPRNEIERRLVTIFAEVLNVDEGVIGIDSNFFDLGGHSLKAISLIAKIHKELNIKIQLTEIFKIQTVRGLAKHLAGAVEVMYTSIESVEKKEYYPLSSAQKRMYVLQQVDVKGTTYNVYQSTPLAQQAHKDILQNVFEKIIKRHESFRTSFIALNGEMVQRVHDNVEFEIEYYDLEAEREKSKRIKEILLSFVRPFDLSQTPLLRVGLIKEAKETFTLLIDMHHIIADGTSMARLLEDYRALLAGEALSTLRLQYRDYSAWQNNLIGKGELKKQEEFWLKEFEVFPPALMLPTDYERPSIQNFEGNRLSFEIGAGETGGLNQLSKLYDATLFMTLLAAFNVLLFKLCGQEDIVVGTPVACRPHADLENIVGMFVNALGLRNKPGGDKTFREFLLQVKDKTLEAFENQEYQFEDLVGKIAVMRDISRNPVFDVSFGVEDKNQNLLGINLERPLTPLTGLYDFENQISKFDLTLAGAETGDTMLFVIEYSTKLFKKSTIERFSHYFKRIVTSIVENPQKKISEIDILSSEERTQLLVEFNNTYLEIESPGDKALHELFEERVEKKPDGIAVIEQGVGAALRDRPDSVVQHMTYKELNEKSNHLVQVLKEQGVGADTIVGIMVEPSIEMVIGILAILKAGGAYLPIEPDYPGERTDYMLKDSNVKILLTASVAQVEVKVKEKKEPIELIDIFELNFPPTLTLTSTLSNVSSINLAYIIYTSGTTGQPKGVMVDHKGIVNYSWWRLGAYNFRETDTTLQLLSYCFDGFGANFYSPLLSGAAVVMLPSSRRIDFSYIKETIKVHGITNISLVPSMYEQILDCTDPGDLDSLRFVVLAGEKAGLELIKKSKEKCPAVLYINEYGPTEASVTAAVRIGMDENTSIIGKSISNVQIYILDAYLSPVPVGVIGEIHIAGTGLARGYLNRSDLTIEKFINGNNDQWPMINDRLYRTGDMALWRSDGNIQLIGRMDNQVKVRGFRIETGEIEEQLLTHADVKLAAVIERISKTGNAYLCAYLVLQSAHFTPEPGALEFREHLSQWLPGYMIPSYFLIIPELPLTTTGKIDRKRLPDPEDPNFMTIGQYVAPASSVERKLALVWQRVLAKDKIGICDDFFMLGGNSLKATSLISHIEKELSVKVPLQELFRRPTIKSLAEYLETAETARCTNIEPAPTREYYPASSQQKRMYFIQQMDESSTVYNCPMMIPMEGDIRRERLEDAFKWLIARHESLRTSFHMVKDKPVQKVHEPEDVPFALAKYDPTIAFIHPFNLSRVPLLRAGLLKRPQEHLTLIVDMHHIITDGTSMKVIVEDFLALYEGRQLPGLRLHYKDYACWQNSSAQKEAIKKQAVYWLNKLQGNLPVLNLPLDYPRPAVQSFEGSAISFKVDKEESQKLRQLAMEQDVTLFMVLLAAYNILLAKLQNSGDIAVGIPVAGRRHADLERIVGLFLNTLVLRNNPFPGKPFDDFLMELKENTLEAFENQEYQFEELVENLEAKRDTSRNPLVDVMFNFLNLVDNMGTGDVGTGEKVEHRTAKTDLFLSGMETGEGLFFELEYCTRLFNPKTIERFINYFKKILWQITQYPVRRISGFDILSEEERKRLLYDYNDTQVAYAREKTLVALVEEQVEKTPDAAAVVFENRTITYRILNEESNRLAGMLREAGASDDSLVGILLSRTDELIIGVMGILKADGVCLPLDLTYPEKRIARILADSGAGFLVKNEGHDCAFASSFQGVMVDSDSRKRQNFNCVNSGYSQDSHSFAFVIYTSGSTGKPKGTPLCHYGISNHTFTKIKELSICSQDVLCHNLNISFVASIWQFFAPLFTGALLHVYPEEIISHPYELFLNAVKDGITVLEVVPSVLKAYLELLEAGKEPVKLEQLKRLALTGEKVLPLLVNQFYRQYNTPLVNAYGQSECSDDTLHFHIPYNRETALVPIGRPANNTRLYILDKDEDRTLCPIGVPGELFISGDGVALGYLNRPELTAEKFIKISLNTGHSTFNTLVFQTGDLARYLANGNVEYLGRVDHQIKIRGFRIEPSEIESLLMSFDGIREAVVNAVETAGIETRDNREDKVLCAYFTSNREVNTSQIKGLMSLHLPAYMVPTYFVHLEALPMTPNQKIDRNALPDPEIEEDREYQPPETDVERKLVKIWSDVLRRDSGRIGLNTNFFQLGGHSLMALHVIEKIHKTFNTRVPVAEIFNRQTLRQLAGYIEAAPEEGFVAIESKEEKEYYTLSSAQKRMYTIQQLTPGEINYNIPYIQVLNNDVQVDKLEKTIRKLIDRHESLRTSFEMVKENVVQRIHKSVDLDVEYYDLATKDREDDYLIRNFIRPFDLAQTPLLRVRLIKTGEMHHIFLVDMHHIVSDGISMDRLVKEFMTAYYSEVLVPLPIQYRDYAEWQNRELQKRALKKQEDYWLRVFENDIPILHLPYDFMRPTVQSFQGEQLYFEVGEEKTAALKQLAESVNGTMFMVLLSIFNVMLGKLSGEEDIVVGTPVSGRRHADLEHIIGMFVNTLALRNKPAADKPFWEFLRELSNNSVEAFENQDYQFEDLVERLLVPRDTGRNPIFDVVFAWQNPDVSGEVTANAPTAPTSLTEKSSSLDNFYKVSRFDITLFGQKVNKGLRFNMEYCTGLFRQDTMRRFVDYFLRILVSVLDNSGRKIREIDILSEEEKRRLLVDFNDTARDYPADKTVHWLFGEQAVENPDRLAVDAVARSSGFMRVSLTYRELNERADCLAGLLRQKGVQGDTLVGLAAERSMETIVGILGILKAGGAYLPVDPQYPGNRKKVMLTESAVNLLLTDHDIEDVPGQIPAGVEVLDLRDTRLSRRTSSNRWDIDGGSNLVYVMYTSGSTGVPKGVLVEHRSVVRLVKNTNFVSFEKDDRIMQTGALEFDASTFEIWGALLNGLTLYFEDKETLLTADKLEEVIKMYGITTLWMTSPLFNQVSRENPGIFSGLKNFLVGGDVLSPSHINEIRRAYPSLTIINGYGPTENTTFSAVYRIEKEYRDSIPIGMPIANSTAFVVDRYGHLQPLMVAGELWVGGDGVGRGYLNQPELTAEKYDYDLWDCQDYQDEKKRENYQKFLWGSKGWFLQKESPGRRRQKLYKTGDLVRWLPNGNLEFLGRVDQQVKIRGYRIEMGEIENRLLDVIGIKEAVVVNKKRDNGDKYLVAYLFPGKDNPFNFTVSELRQSLSLELPDYMIPAYFVQLPEVPLTPSGKINRSALPDPEIEAGQGFTAPRNETERKLVKIWAEVLELPEEVIGIDSDFFEIGGHSIKAINLLAKIHKVLGIKVQLLDLFVIRTARKLAEHIKENEQETYISILPVEEKEYYAMSPSQKRLYLTQQMELGSLAYNSPLILELADYNESSARNLENAFMKLINRHEALRTSFEIVHDEPVQKIYDKVEFEIEYHDAVGLLERHADIIRDFIRPFDLARVPLLRVRLSKTSDTYLLMVDIHHIILDGISQDILVRDFMTFYYEGQMRELTLQYKDFSEWQKKLFKQGFIKQQEAYWLKQFEEEVPLLDLPIDYPRPENRSYQGKIFQFKVEKELTAKIKNVVSETETTLYMILLAAYNVLLYIYTKQENIVVGSPVTGRRHADLQSILGVFVNMLAMRNRPQGNKTFREFLEEVKGNAINAFENQDYQFDDLVTRLGFQRSLNRSPLVETVFTLQNPFNVAAREPQPEESKRIIKPYEYNFCTVKFDLTLDAVEVNDWIRMWLTYSTELFRTSTVEKIKKHYIEVLEQVIDSQDIQLKEISLSYDVVTAKSSVLEQESGDFEF